MRTWAVIHKALSRSEVSAQLKNNFEHVIEHNKIDHAYMGISSCIENDQSDVDAYLGSDPQSAIKK